MAVLRQRRGTAINFKDLTACSLKWILGMALNTKIQASGFILEQSSGTVTK